MGLNDTYNNTSAMSRSNLTIKSAALEVESPNLVYNGRRTVAIETLGCKLNQADSDSIARQFLSAGFRVSDNTANADIYVLNTCTVTHVADRKTRHLLRMMRRSNPNAVIVATGCYAQRAPRDLEQMPEVDLVVGNSEKSHLLELLGVEHYDKQRDLVHLPSQTRAMVKIQEGCSQVCAFCIVPRVRGREQSIPLEDLVREVQARVQEGYREVVLTGTQLGSYGFDLAPGTNIETPIRRILQDTNIQRLRVSSLQPQDITPELIRLWQDPRFCRHLHMPLQSGSDAVLKRMRRRYDTATYASTAAALREAVPDISITTDLIVGFPGETQEEFQASYHFCQEIQFAAIHVFPYSPRKGTTAFHLPHPVPEPVKRERAKQMLALARECAQRFRQGFIGHTLEVLWEDSNPGDNGASVWSGLTDNYIRVHTTSCQNLANRIEPCRMFEERDGALWGEMERNEVRL